MELLWDFLRKFLLSARAGSVVRRISRLSLVGMGLSIGALLLVMSVMNALNENIRNRTLSVEPHLTIEYPELKSSKEVSKTPLFQKIKENTEIKYSVIETQDLIIRTADGRFRGAIAKGQSWNSLRDRLKEIIRLQKQSAQQMVNEFVIPEKGEIMVGIDLAHSLGVFEGDTVTILSPEGLLLPPSEVPKFEKVSVRQILSTNLSDVDAQYVFYVIDESLTSLRDGASRRVGLEVWLPDIDQAESLKQEWIAFDQRAVIQTWKDRNSAIFFALKLEKLMIGLFLSLASFVAGLSLVTLMSLLISQKKEEIALLQVLGLSQKAVVQLFHRLGFLVAIIGIAAGFVIGLSSSVYLQFYPLEVLPDIYYDSQIPAKINFAFFLVVLLTACGLAWFGSLWSARAAAEFSPSRALRIKK